MKFRDEFWVLTRNLETGTVARMTRIQVPELDPEESRLPVKVRDLAEAESTMTPSETCARCLRCGTVREPHYKKDLCHALGWCKYEPVIVSRPKEAEP